MTAAVRLMERGLLDLDAPVETYLRDWPHKGRGVTVRRLAAHQSGLSDAFANDHYSSSRHFATLDEAYQEIKAGAVEYEPGSRTVYATGVYTIIGRVLEVVGGRDYQRLMHEEVFVPAGVPAIVANDRRAIIPHRTGFYAERDGGGFEHGLFFDPSHKLPGAGYLATARELALFGSALLRSRVIGDRGRQELFRAVPLANGTPTEFALGLRVSSDAHGRVLHLPGGGIGISSWLFIHPDADLVVAILSNVNTAPVGGSTHERIAAAFLR
jgi:CubicO group peptidase (beta-lactamase class C family)